MSETIFGYCEPNAKAYTRVRVVMLSIVERGLIAAGMISIAFIAVSAHLTSNQQFRTEFENRKLRSSIDALSQSAALSAREQRDNWLEE